MLVYVFMLKLDAKGKKYKHMTIGAWKGFKRTIKHNNKEVEVKTQEMAVIEENDILCLHCLKRLKTNSKLLNHFLKTSFLGFHINILNFIVFKVPLRNMQLRFFVSALRKIAITLRIY